MKKIIFISLIALMVFLSSCSFFSTEQKDSIRAFGDVIVLYPVEEYEPNRWKINSPDGAACFAFDNMSVSMAVDATPFIAAGADLSKLGNVGEHNL